MWLRPSPTVVRVPFPDAFKIPLCFLGALSVQV